VQKAERRKDRRLDLKYHLSCQRIGRDSTRTYKGLTRDVSCGGAYFWISNRTFKSGEMIRIELMIPPKAGVLESGGRVRCYAIVLRSDCRPKARRQGESFAAGYGIAAQFHDFPKLCIG